MLKDEKEDETIHQLVLENQRLLSENNQLLKKMHRTSVWSLWLRVVWFLVIIGAPFVLYYYIVEPYFTSLGSSFETFQDGLQEIPGWKQFYSTVGGKVDGGE